jgi:pyruvate ferredoxin oxidoreductase beta subunit
MKQALSLVPHGTSTCPGCGGSICVRTVLGELGGNIILVTSNVCAGGATYRTSLPGICQMFTNAGSVASGVANALAYQGRDDVTVVAFAGDGGTADIGLQAVSGAAERNDAMIYVCNDNEAYMNTLGQKSGTTPLGAATSTTPRGKSTGKKNMPMIMAHHGIPYVATASVSNPRDLARKVRKAASIAGFRYLHVLTPCPTGWGYKPEDTIRIGELAVSTGIFPLYEIENGALRVTYTPERLAKVREYLSLQRRFRQMTGEQMDRLQSEVERSWERMLKGGSFFG